MPHILVTGASSGIGEAIARHFGGLADHVLTIAARRQDRLRALADELDAQTFVRRTDVSDVDERAALIEEAEAALGPIDVLVNNAGIQYVEPTAQVDAERIQRIVEVNLTAPLDLVSRVLPAMLERDAGTVVNISSMAGITPTPGMTHYNATKAGLAAASESMRVELRKTNVNIVTVYPGPVESPMESAARDKFTDSGIVKRVPTGTAPELAKLVARAVEKRRARVIYPRVYGASRYARGLSQWLTDRLTPPLDESRS